MGNVRFELDATTGDAPLKLLYASTAHYDGSWHSIMHTHPHAELFYCVSGKGGFRVSGGDIPVHADDLILVNPFVEHTEYSLKNEGLEYIVLGIAGVEFRSADGQSVRCRSLSFTQNQRELLPYFADLITEVAHKQEHYLEVCDAILHILLVKIRRQPDFNLTYATPPKMSKACAELKRYLDEHYYEHLDLDVLAQRMHMSKYYLAHAFRKQFAVSPMSYLSARRIDEVKHLLLQTDHAIADIGFIVGFTSPSYFSQCFHKLVGMSPIAFRQASMATPNEIQKRKATQ